MPWIIPLLGYLVFATIYGLIRRNLGKNFAEHNRLVNAFFFLAVLWPVGLLIGLLSHPNLHIGWQNMGLLLAGSIVWPLANLAGYKASRHIDAGMFSILSNLTPIVTITVAWNLLGEGLNHHQLFGAVIILASAVLVTLPSLRRRRRANREGLTFTLISVVLVGLGIVFERYMLKRMDIGAYFVFGWGAQTFWMVTFALSEYKNLYLLKDRSFFLPTLGYGLTAALRGVGFVAVLKFSNNASLVGAAASFLSVSVVVAAYFFTNEKDGLALKIPAAILGTVGLIILSFS
jgi:drug/metabolite transporter (DMT)-like permease